MSSPTDYPQLNYGSGSKWIKHLTQNRLGTFNGGHFSDVNLSAMLFTHRLDDQHHVKLQVWSAPGLSKPDFKEALEQKFRPARKGEAFGPSFSINIPSYFQQYERVQSMVFTPDGTPLQGITGGHGGDRRVDHIIPREASSCNGMFGVPWNGDTIAPPDMNRYFSLASADLVEISETLPGNSGLQNKALVVANEIMNVFNNRDLTSITRARKLAEEVFGEHWDKKGERIYAEGPERPQIWGIGYCHIDTAWLWPYSVTQQKVARSWSTQVDLMERYPEHRFTCSQAQQFKWLEEKVMEGKFHLVGGAWVENDANMPSGEALIGSSYALWSRCDTAWLPDSFGLTGSLPQLIRGAGMKYFFTQKLSCNVFPHSTFNWVGIDGTQVLCHMTPVDTYTAQATVGDNLESSDTALLVFGNGDGGGGPLSKMLENLRRIRAAGNNNRELPPNGELYLEFHRGTYTSHGSIKKGNRKSEILLRDIEHLATLASLSRTSAEYQYPKSTIDVCWEKVLLNQFLPGSAIGMVYDDAEKLYAEVRKDGEAVLEAAFKTLFPTPVRAPGSIIAYNTTFFPRRDVVQVPLAGKTSNLKSQVVQASEDGSVGYALLDCSEGGMLLDLRAFTNGHDHFVLRNSSVQMTISGRPNYWDAWDVEVHHLEKATPLQFTNISVVAGGPLRASLRAVIKYGKSTITTLNTKLDIAKFEVCGHKFADLSEFGYGVAISTAPDAEQDQGTDHVFSWAVMPHKGSFLESDVPVAAYLYNSPLHVPKPFTVQDANNVFLETVKRGELDHFAFTSIILRLYEAYGGHARATLKIAESIPVAKAYITNLLEDEEEELIIRDVTGGSQTVKLVIGTKHVVEQQE
ncbi:glycosyl hydrolases family 38 N-terminal domain-containing protein [Irpex lacteus]|nr:glycosyl hydrolases family 38 N-terminal domain-containing protein [Irpex lacteus]